jgi:hypothetical protein
VSLGSILGRANQEFEIAFSFTEEDEEDFLSDESHQSSFSRRALTARQRGDIDLQSLPMGMIPFAFITELFS